MSVAPPPSTTVTPEVGSERTPVDTRLDAIALHQDVARVRLRAGAVEDAHVAEEDVRHGGLRAISRSTARKSRSSRAHSSGRS